MRYFISLALVVVLIAPASVRAETTEATVAAMRDNLALAIIALTKNNLFSMELLNTLILAYNKDMGTVGVGRELLTGQETDIAPVESRPSEFELKLAELVRERTALIEERNALYRKAEAMGGSKDWIAGYKRYLAKDVNARLDALNEKERELNATLGL